MFQKKNRTFLLILPKIVSLIILLKHYIFDLINKAKIFLKKIFYLIPFYNSESTILNCLTSIRSEKYKIEVILINDNSSDNSLQIVNSVKNNLPFVLHVIINKENLGISKSLNLGIDFALKKCGLFN